MRHLHIHLYDCDEMFDASYLEAKHRRGPRGEFLKKGGGSSPGMPVQRAHGQIAPQSGVEHADPLHREHARQ